MGRAIMDFEIQAAEQLLLPEGRHFEPDALQVIRNWESVDVSACPGSGKTTVLLAKLKLLADRMPLPNNAGICVLSHTNIAVDEIKRKLVGYADKLLGYPNYVGTIQSFIDRFVSIPYILRTKGRLVQPVDDRMYAQFMLCKMKKGAYSSLKSVVECSYKYSGTRYSNLIDYIATLYLNNSDALCNQTRVLAGVDKDSTQQFKMLLDDLLKDEGIIRYQDAFRYASNAIEELSIQYTDLYSNRFRYVYVDEYQDCNEIQRNVLHKLFDPAKCVVTHIGDADQAIYSSSHEKVTDWCPSDGFLAIGSSCRYGQAIADILSPLRSDKCRIISLEEGFKPVLIIYDKNTIGDVLGKFVSILEEKGLCDSNGIYKAIGFIKKEDAAGINIRSYWAGFDGSNQTSREYKYWGIIDDVCSQLRQGKLYRAEFLVRKLICRLFHYAKIKNAKTGREHTAASIRVTLKEKKYNDIYTEFILSLAQLNDYTRESVDAAIRTTITNLLNQNGKRKKNIFDNIPDHFMEELTIEQKDKSTRNVFVEPLRKRRIQFDTVHGVKGETHDATLYLETESSNNSDIRRILYCYGIEKARDSSLYNYSRKVVYVGMSRPRKLLCLAVQESTYEKGRNAFLEWDKHDLRKSKG